MLKRFLSKKAQPTPIRAKNTFAKAAHLGYKPVSLARPTYITKTMDANDRDKLVDDVMIELQSLQQNMSNFLQQEEGRAQREQAYVNAIPKQAPISTAPKQAVDLPKVSNTENKYVANPQVPPPIVPPASTTNSGSPVQVIFGATPQQASPFGQPPFTPTLPNPALPNPALTYPVFPGYYPHNMPTQPYVPPVPVHPYNATGHLAPTIPAPLYVPVVQQPVAVPQPQQPVAVPQPQPPVAAPQPQPPVAAPQQPVSSGGTSAPSSQTEQKDIIDHFMHTLAKDDTVVATPTNPLAHSEDIHNEICSEELAELYINQGHNDRAIEIYHRLCDKYPEKSAYFVQKIKECKKK